MMKNVSLPLLVLFRLILMPFSIPWAKYPGRVFQPIHRSRGFNLQILPHILSGDERYFALMKLSV